MYKKPKTNWRSFKPVTPFLWEDYIGLCGPRSEHILILPSLFVAKFVTFCSLQKHSLFTTHLKIKHHLHLILVWTNKNLILRQSAERAPRSIPLLPESDNPHLVNLWKPWHPCISYPSKFKQKIRYLQLYVSLSLSLLHKVYVDWKSFQTSGISPVHGTVHVLCCSE